MRESRSSLVSRVLSDRLLTIPNLLSLGRLAAIPLFLYLLAEDRPAEAAVLLGVLGFTDWADGWIARRTNSVSELGVLLDPLADRILLFTTVVALMVDGRVPAWLAAPVLVREPSMLVGASVVALVWNVRVDVTWVGKAGTFLLLVAFPLLLLGTAGAGGYEIVRAAGYVTGVAGLMMSWYAAFAYIPMVMERIAAREEDDQMPVPGQGR